MKPMPRGILLSEGVKPIGFSWEAPPRPMDPKGVARIRTIAKHVELRGEPAVVVDDGVIITTKELDGEIAWDKRALASHMRGFERIRKAELDAEREDADRRDLQGFERTLRSAAAVARALKVLNKQVSVKRKFASRKEHIEGFVADGAVVRSYPNSKYKRRLELLSGSFFTQADLTKLGLDYAEYLATRIVR